jgi:hypothetical protein
VRKHVVSRTLSLDPPAYSGRSFPA